MAGIRLSALVRRLRRDVPSGDGTDADLLARFACGQDDAAFELLVWRHGAMVLGACRRALGNSEDAEDAFQATFLVLARKAGTVSRGVALPAWLHRVAVRIAGRLSRRRRPIASLEVDLAGPVGADPVERADELAVLDEEIDQIPERCRRAVVLCYLEGLTAAEAGRQLGCPTGTVESRLAAARKLLRVSLTRRGVTLPVGVLAVVSGQGALAPEAIARVVRAAAAFAREGAAIAAGVVNPSSVKLAQGVLAMGYTRWWVGAAIVVVAVAVSTGVVWADREPPAVMDNDPPAAKPAAVAIAPPPVAKDEAWPFAREVPTLLGWWRGFSPDGRSSIFIVDKSVVYYDIDSGVRRTVIQRQNIMSDIAISPDGKRIATAEGLEGVKIWDATTGTFQEAYWPSGGLPAQQVAFTPDGSRLIVLCWSRRKTQVWVCDLATGKEIGWPTRSLSESESQSQSIELVAGGRFVLTCDSRWEKVMDRPSVKRLYTLSDPLTGVVGKPVELTVPMLEHTGQRDLMVSPDGKGILVANGLEALIIDPSTGRARLRLGRLKHTISALAYSPDGKRVAAASSVVCPPPSSGPGGASVRVAGKLDVASPTEIVIWDAATGRELARLVDKEWIRDYLSVRFSPDNSYLMAESSNYAPGGAGGGTTCAGVGTTIWGRPPVMKPRRAEATPLTPASMAGVPDRFQSLIRDLSADGVADSRRVEGVFTAALGRLPTDIEARTLAAQIAAQADKTAALRNLLATLVDSAEFKAHLAALQKLAK